METPSTDQPNEPTVLYTVEVREDFEGNQGNPLSLDRSAVFYDKAEAEEHMQEELAQVTSEPGVIRHVVLYESRPITEPGEWEDDDLCFLELKADICKSKALPAEGVIVYYRHHRYMNYAYNIVGVEDVSNSNAKTFADLPYSEDTTFAIWAEVYDDSDQLSEAYDAGVGIFGKITSGATLIREFLWV